MRAISSSRRGVSPVIAVILLVAITTVLAAVVYVTVSSLVTEVVEVTPYVILTKGETSFTTTEIQVSGIESVHTHYQYMAVLLINGTKDDGSTMKPLQVATIGNLTFDDLGDDKLSIGDKFEIAIVPGTNYQLSVIFIQNGNEAGFVQWHT